MISPCFLRCLRRASSGRALQVPSAPCSSRSFTSIQMPCKSTSFTSIQMFHTHTYTNLQSSTCFPGDIYILFLYTHIYILHTYIYICNNPKSPKAVLFESLRKVAQRKDHRRETIAMPQFYARGFIAIVLGFHGRGFIAMSLVLQPRVYSNECLAPMIHVTRS